MKAGRSWKRVVFMCFMSVTIAATGQWVLHNYFTWDVVGFAGGAGGVPLQSVAEVASRYRIRVVKIEAPSTIFTHTCDVIRPGDLELVARYLPEQPIAKITVRGALPREKFDALRNLAPDLFKLFIRYYVMPRNVLSFYPLQSEGRIYLLAFHVVLQAGLFVVIGIVGHIGHYFRLRRAGKGGS